MPTDDATWMSRAFELAERGLGVTSPNPAVGAVVVAAGALVGEGFHRQYGAPHAEVNALAAAGAKARGSTVYVTLEPCRHEGKTPPCTDALVAAGVSRVVFAASDPNPVAAGGAAVLRDKGVAVDGGVLGGRATAFYSYFFKHVRRSQSYVLAKWGMTADGRIATTTGDSHWITSDEARARARLLRAASDVVMVGVGTVLRDDPRLTARCDDRREPLRVIVDSLLRTPPSAELFTVAGGAVVLACAESADAEREARLRERGAEVLRLPSHGSRVSIEALLDELHRRGKLRIMVEGGSTLLGATFDARRIDEVCVFVASKIVGGKQAPGAVSGRGLARMSEALALADARWEAAGPDMMLRGRIGSHDWTV
jgi:diaminohydroxyphosphoribosylaminopyrimidine deaminase/5-amino-6-(5-phosphoribosylamino)uracil reductase